MPTPHVPPAELPACEDIIAGKYALERRVGEGGMGVVYEAMHLRLRMRLAIKVLRPQTSDAGELLARFEREARITAQLRSGHFARVIDIDRLPSGLPYIVLEYLDGRDLEAEILCEGPLPIPEAVDVVVQVAEAMKEAHDLGIVHRDLKPSNLFVCRAEGRRFMKILDFGISRVETGEPKITASSSYIGTPHYAAPEQLRDSAAADARSDIWSLGVVLFELLTGRTPFRGGGVEVIARVMVDPVPWPCNVRPAIPPELARVVLRALQREPDERFQSMKDLVEALAPFGTANSTAEAAAGAPPGRARLGELLVAEGLVSAADLARALGEQRRSGCLLGRVLVDMGLVTQADLLAALAKQQGIGVDQAALAAGGLDDGWFREPERVEEERGDREALTLHGTPVPASRSLFGKHAWLAAVALAWIGSLLAVAAAR
ncbi:MAG TPA: protein kinase [Polyangiaceae bacterium]|jgi:serine/threonine-protein kinase